MMSTRQEKITENNWSTTEIGKEFATLTRSLTSAVARGDLDEVEAYMNYLNNKLDYITENCESGDGD